MSELGQNSFLFGNSNCEEDTLHVWLVFRLFKLQRSYYFEWDV